ncbi:UNVERIFIED_CONTAM: hypothetical protein Sradi_1894400 [Sesamum radiatum]|uniref:Uncharacterized protein n=1 Tax=Sesamum radiatum TaxID=300843 RepID=A0AAW2TX30_SESRA
MVVSFTVGRSLSVCDLGIKQRIISVVYAKANGQVEVTNCILVQGIKIKLEQIGRQWVDALLSLLWSYRTTLRSTIGETPFNIMYGLEAVIPTRAGSETVLIQHYKHEGKIKRAHQVIPPKFVQKILKSVHQQHNQMIKQNYQGIFIHPRKKEKEIEFKASSFQIKHHDAQTNTQEIRPRMEGFFIQKGGRHIHWKVAGYLRLSCTGAKSIIIILERTINKQSLEFERTFGPLSSFFVKPPTYPACPHSRGIDPISKSNSDVLLSRPLFSSGRSSYSHSRVGGKRHLEASSKSFIPKILNLVISVTNLAFHVNPPSHSSFKPVVLPPSPTTGSTISATSAAYSTSTGPPKKCEGFVVDRNSVV